MTSTKTAPARRPRRPLAAAAAAKVAAARSEDVVIASIEAAADTLGAYLAAAKTADRNRGALALAALAAA